MSHYSTGRELQANAESFDLSSDSIMTDILREAQAKAKGKAAAGYNVAHLLDMNLAGEVGKFTPPVRIYKVGPDGELILKEQVQAITFRRRVLESIGGQAYVERMLDLQRKRQRAGQMMKARGVARRKRLGLQPREILKVEDDDDGA